MLEIKRTIASLLAFLLGISMLAGCGGNSGGGNSGGGTTTTPPASNSNQDEDGSSYGIDLTSAEVQPMSEERATRERLEETVREWLEGATLFLDNSEMSKRTYKDFVDFIGCDATEYYFDVSRNTRVYTWRAEGADTSKLGVWFEEKNGIWSLSFTGSTNL